MGDVHSAPQNFSQTKKSFIQRGQFPSPQNEADEAVMKDLGQERKGPAMTERLMVLFLQPEQELEHTVIIRV